MRHHFSRRGVRAIVLAFLTLTGTLTGCGGDSGGGLTDPPSDPSDPSDPGTGPAGPAPVGRVMYAVDLSNNFLVFGSGSIEALSAKMRISGVPILKRIVGLAIRPSDGAVVGVGNDSRVYTIDPLTAEATPIGEPFTPGIASFFDIHFAMALEPNGQRIRLIAAESGANWSIDINTGTATDAPGVRYGAGSEYEGQTPRLLGLVYPTLPDSAKGEGWCANLAYGVDVDAAIMVASCDPATGYWFPLADAPADSAGADSSAVPVQPMASVRIPKELAELRDQLLRCGEFMASPSGSDSDGEQEPPQDAGPFFPRAPDTEFWVWLNKVGELQNRQAVMTPINAHQAGLTLGAEIPSNDLVQSVVESVGGPYESSNYRAGSVRGRLELQLASASVGEGSAAAGSGDPWTACAGGT